MSTIGWDEPRKPQRYCLLVLNDTGSRHATDEDLQKAGYVKASAPVPMTGVEVREALAWRRIDKWLRASPSTRAATVTPTDSADRWFALPMSCHTVSTARLITDESRQPWYNTKTEAVEALAKWCEANP